jgi:hypothetical protein
MVLGKGNARKIALFLSNRIVDTALNHCLGVIFSQLNNRVKLLLL